MIFSDRIFLPSPREKRGSRGKRTSLALGPHIL
jgi:hypothetical protein